MPEKIVTDQHMLLTVCNSDIHSGTVF